MLTFFQEWLEVMKARRPVFRADMDAHLQLIENMLKNYRYILSEETSLADFAVFGAINPLRYSGNKLPRKFKRLRTWYNTIDRI